MVNVILINGSINSGKTTTAKLLVEKLSNMALVEVDELRNFIAWMPLEDSFSLNYKNAISIINNFAEEGIGSVVPYVFNQETYDYFKKELESSHLKIYAFTLNPKMDVIIEGRGSRGLDDWERDRIKYHYSININRPGYGEIIDNTNLSPNKVADLIVEKTEIEEANEKL